MTVDPHLTAASPVQSTTRGLPSAPLHPISAILVIVCDGLWSIPELIAAISVVGLPLVPFLAAGSGICCALGVLIGQRLAGRDVWHVALIKGLLFGLTAAVPIPLTGSAAGCLCLGWSGLVYLSSSFDQRKPAG